MSRNSGIPALMGREEVNNLEDLEAALDARGIPWDLYNGMQHNWIIRLGVYGANERIVYGNTIAEVLRLAIDTPVPVIVPNRPTCPTGLRAVKDGSTWKIADESGLGHMFNLKTKREALEAIARFESIFADSMAKWQANEEPKCRGTYGTDWVWKHPEPNGAS